MVNKPTKPARSVRGNHCGAAQGVEITAQQAGNIVEVTCITIGQLEKAGWFKRETSGLYSLIEFMRGWTRYRNELIKRARQPKSGNRMQDARTIEIELRTARDSGELMDMSAAIAYVQSVAGEFRASFGALPARVTRDLELRAKIENAVNECFNQV